MTRTPRPPLQRMLRLAWPPLFAGLQVRLMVVLLLGLLFSATSTCRWVFAEGCLCPTATTDGPAMGTVSLGIALAALAFLVACNALIERRRGRFDRELAAYANDPSIPDDLREKIVIFLQRDRNGRY